MIKDLNALVRLEAADEVLLAFERVQARREKSFSPLGECRREQKKSSSSLSECRQEQIERPLCTSR